MRGAALKVIQMSVMKATNIDCFRGLIDITSSHNTAPTDNSSLRPRRTRLTTQQASGLISDLLLNNATNSRKI